MRTLKPILCSSSSSVADPDPDPIIRRTGTDPDPAAGPPIIKQNSKNNLESYGTVL
jgi:hypothetical protein